MEPTNGKKSKLIILAIIIIIAVAVILWMRGGSQPAAPATTGQSVSDMQNAAASVDTGNLDQAFTTINSDVNSL